MTKPKRDLLDVLILIAVTISILLLASLLIGMWITLIIPVMNGSLKP